MIKKRKNCIFFLIKKILLGVTYIYIICGHQFEIIVDVKDNDVKIYFSLIKILNLIR